MFALGLVSGMHCVQMCGPIVLSYSLPLAGGAPRRHTAGAPLVQPGAHNHVRGLGCAGGRGGRRHRTALAGWRASRTAARIVAGAAMIVAGILMLRRFAARGWCIERPRHGGASCTGIGSACCSRRPLAASSAWGWCWDFCHAAWFTRRLLKAMDAASRAGGRADHAGVRIRHGRGAVAHRAWRHFVWLAAGAMGQRPGAVAASCSRARC